MLINLDAPPSREFLDSRQRANTDFKFCTYFRGHNADLKLVKGASEDEKSTDASGMSGRRRLLSIVSGSLLDGDDAGSANDSSQGLPRLEALAAGLLAAPILFCMVALKRRLLSEVDSSRGHASVTTSVKEPTAGRNGRNYGVRAWQDASSEEAGAPCILVRDAGDSAESECSCNPPRY